MQCKDIQELPILEFLYKRLLDGSGKAFSFVIDPERPSKWDAYSMSNAFPPGVPQKLLLAKMDRMVNKGLVDGCACGCRGDFEITEKGIDFMVDTMMRERGWCGVSKKPEDGAKVLTAHYMASWDAVGRVIYGSAIYSDRSYRDDDGGCLDTPSWWRPINSFHSLGKHHVTGRGTVYQVENAVEFERSLDAFKATYGSKVLIGGVEFEVVAIESWCVQRPIRAGEIFGICVRD